MHAMFLDSIKTLGCGWSTENLSVYDWPLAGSQLPAATQFRSTLASYHKVSMIPATQLTIYTLASDQLRWTVYCKASIFKNQ